MQIRLLVLSFVMFLSFWSIPAQAQQQINKNINVDGVNRSYIVYIPVNFDPAENMPALFFFHGGGGAANGGIFECDFRSLANSDRFIAVYPQAINSSSGNNSWDCLGDYHGGIDEMGFVSAMIDALAADYNIDTNRVYAGGYSLGGSIVYDIAAYLPDKVAGIAPVAANMWEWTLSDVNWSTSVACVHLLGTNDFYAPYNGGWVPSAAAQHAYWVAKNQAVSPPETESLGGGVTRYTWVAGEGCHAVEHFRRQGGGHDVPSFATTVIWDFVSQHALDGVIGCTDESIDGDFNGDGIVDGADLARVLGAWGTDAPGGDLNGDGIVDGADLALVLANWG